MPAGDLHCQTAGGAFCYTARSPCSLVIRRGRNGPSCDLSQDRTERLEPNALLLLWASVGYAKVGGVRGGRITNRTRTREKMPMRRDMDLVRDILRYLAKQPAGTIVKEMNIRDVDNMVIAEHVADLNDAGLIDVCIAKNDVGFPQEFEIFRLTWAGQEFLDLADNDTVWNRVKARVAAESVSLGFDLLKGALTAGIKASVPGVFQ